MHACVYVCVSVCAYVCAYVCVRVRARVRVWAVILAKMEPLKLPEPGVLFSLYEW